MFYPAKPFYFAAKLIDLPAKPILYSAKPFYSPAKLIDLPTKLILYPANPFYSPTKLIFLPTKPFLFHSASEPILSQQSPYFHQLNLFFLILNSSLVKTFWTNARSHSWSYCKKRMNSNNSIHSKVLNSVLNQKYFKMFLLCRIL